MTVEAVGQKGKCEDAMSMDLKMEEGSIAEEHRQSPQVEKARKRVLHQSLWGELSATSTLILAPSS